MRVKKGMVRASLVGIRKARDVDPLYQVGDCVVLRSGGPPMTVVRLDPIEYADAPTAPDVFCFWENEAGQHRSRKFRPCMLDYWGN